MKFIKEKKSIIIFIASTICLVTAFIIEKTSNSSFTWSLFITPSFYSSKLFISLLFYLFGIVLLYPDLLIDYIKDVKEKEYFSESLLMIISSIGAIALLELPEVIIILLFRIVGETLEEYASNKAKKSISSLLNSIKFSAHLINNSSIKDIDTSEIKENDLLEIRPGENIPVDGIIVSGQSNLNLSSLTGESLPKLYKVNDKVISGSINIDSVLVIKATSSFKNSTFSKIINLVENEEISKSKQKTFMDKFAKIYIPSIIGIALLYFFIGLGLNGFKFDSHIKDVVIRSISIILIGCPCSIIISVPLTTFIGIAKASRLGIIIKNGNSIENLSRIKKFAFDKTGTITKGNFKLINVQDISKEHHIIAASLESKISHPISSAITENIKTFLEVKDFNNYPGKGVSGIINSHKYYLGGESFIEENNIKNNFSADNINKVIYLANSKEVIEEFIIADEIKDGATSLISNLKEQGVNKTMMISGDDKKIVLDIASKIGVDESYYLTMPEDKLKIIKENNPLCYVGDGINDSPSLLSATVGISMGQIGSDIALESSDIIICNDSLNKISEVKRLSKYVILKNYFGIILSLVLKFIIFILISLNLVNDFALTLASIADTGVMVVAIINALLMYLYKPKYIKS